MTMTSRRYYSVTGAVASLLLLAPLVSLALQLQAPSPLISHHHCRLRPCASAAAVGSSVSISTRSSSSQSCYRQLSRRSYKRIISPSPTLLFSSSGDNTPQLELENSTSDDNNNNKSPQRWQQPIQSMKRAMLSFINFVITAPSKFKLYYGKLSTKSKVILSIQLLALGLIFGMGLKTTSDVRSRTATRPVEVSYSTFLDLVDVNGKGHLPGKHREPARRGWFRRC